MHIKECKKCIEPLCSWLFISFKLPFNQFLPQVKNERGKQNASDGNLKSTSFRKKLDWLIKMIHIFLFSFLRIIISFYVDLFLFWKIRLVSFLGHLRVKTFLTEAYKMSHQGWLSWRTGYLSLLRYSQLQKSGLKNEMTIISESHCLLSYTIAVC